MQKQPFDRIPSPENVCLFADQNKQMCLYLRFSDVPAQVKWADVFSY